MHTRLKLHKSHTLGIHTQPPTQGWLTHRREHKSNYTRRARYRESLCMLIVCCVCARASVCVCVCFRVFGCIFHNAACAQVFRDDWPCERTLGLHCTATMCTHCFTFVSKRRAESDGRNFRSAIICAAPPNKQTAWLHHRVCAGGANWGGSVVPVVWVSGFAEGCRRLCESGRCKRGANKRTQTQTKCANIVRTHCARCRALRIGVVD